MANNIDIESFKSSVEGIMNFAEKLINSQRGSLSEEDQVKFDAKLNEINFKETLKDVKNSTDVLDRIKSKL